MKRYMMYILFGILLGASGFLTAYTIYVFFPIQSLQLSFVMSYIVTIFIYFIIRTPIYYETTELLYVGNIGGLIYFLSAIILKLMIDSKPYSILSFHASYITLIFSGVVFSISFILVGQLINVLYSKYNENMHM